MPWWLALGLLMLFLAAVFIGIARGMRHKSEDFSRTNRAGLRPDDFGWGVGSR